MTRNRLRFKITSRNGWEVRTSYINVARPLEKPLPRGNASSQSGVSFVILSTWMKGNGPPDSIIPICAKNAGSNGRKQNTFKGTH